ncbi:MAG: beta-lactamase family protein [Deltaproteobacteria bacterium]|nr:beta-lactamase family protein [Deltaproteobacteria bacterium]
MKREPYIFKLCKLLLLILTVFLFFSPASSVRAEQSPVLSGLDNTTFGIYDERTKALRTVLKGLKEFPDVPGAAMLMARHGRVIFQEAYDWADQKSQKPFSVDSVFLIASATKPITATCVMKLVEEGKINLDDPISKYLPLFGHLKMAQTGAPGKAPSIRQCLSHTSGFFGLRGAPQEGMRAVRDFSLSLADSVEIIARQEQLSLPASQFNYGGASYQVVARIVEVVSGKPFEGFMAEQLLKPLGMSGTFFRPSPDQDLGRVVPVYRRVPEKGFVPLTNFDPDPKRRLILASGGLYSCLNDLAIFLQMHLNHGAYGQKRILSPHAVAEMQKNQTGAAKAPYGLGWFLGRPGADGQARLIHHPGLFGTLAWIDKEHGLIAVFITSASSPQVEKIREDVLRQVSDIVAAHKE